MPALAQREGGHPQPVPGHRHGRHLRPAGAQRGRQDDHHEGHRRGGEPFQREGETVQVDPVVLTLTTLISVVIECWYYKPKDYVLTGLP